MELPEAVTSLVNADTVIMGLRAAAIALGGLLLTRVLASLVLRVARRSWTEHAASLARRATLYVGVLLTAAWTLAELGFDLSVVMGVAGVATVAIGFASQTSMSNLISGLFLVVERPFSVGDVITLGSTTGVVLSIDALSVKLRTFDNLYVRIPNETLIKSDLVNMTRFPIRRFDLKFGVPHDADVKAVKTAVLDAVASVQPALREPAPVFMITGLEEAGISLQLSVWGQTGEFIDLKNSTVVAVQGALRQVGVPVWASRRRVELVEPQTPHAG